MIESGTILAGRYEIINLIGSGGMADVYRAKCHEQNRFVAIKVLRQEHNEDEMFVRRFIAEAQATAGFTHPNIVEIYDAGEDKGYHYIVMELCEGMTLKRYIRRYGRLSARETVDYAKKITRGIQAAHKEGIVHRDIKPQNILVSESGEIKVADFGIAKAATGATIAPNLMGSVHYFSPEQAKGGYVDERSDIYSLGITIYEMATGKVPFDGETSVSIALMHLNDEITPPRCYFPDIPVSLEKIILKCTNKRPGQRYQNVQELLDDLDRVFQTPTGEYIEENPMVDDSPTIIKTIGDEKTKEHTKIIETIKKKPAPQEDSDGEAEEEEEESMKPQMRWMVYAILAVGSILLLLVLGYLVGSMMGIIHLPGGKESTEASTEYIATTQEKELVTMPSVMMNDRVSAEKTLESYHLKAIFIYEENVTNYDTNLVVVKQQYAAGSRVEKNSSVELTLGLNPETVTEMKRVEVPFLVNETEEDAEKILTDIGLAVKKIYASSDTVESGHIIKQNPAAGTEVEEGFTVTITISKGASKVKVPTITGLSEKEAKKELNRVGLNLGNVTFDYNGSVSTGEVFYQEIEPGTLVERGTSVAVKISLGENVSYHYEFEVILNESPFAEGESGSLRIDLTQNGQTETIYLDENASSMDFPFHQVFEGKEEGDAILSIYINDELYDEQPVQVEAVED